MPSSPARSTAARDDAVPSRLRPRSGAAPSALNSIGGRVRFLRHEAGLLQADVADALGWCRGHLAQVETGRTLPGREMLNAVAAYFNVSLDWLARGGDMRSDTALNEREALLLRAFRQLPKDEADAHLELVLKRVQNAERVAQPRSSFGTRCAPRVRCEG